MAKKATYDVHPVAALFPMLAEDELAELADDIKQRGLLQPIVLDAEGRILDGRNRLAACTLAGVEPEFAKYDDGDPDGYALAVNIARRHLTTGARAIIAAQAARLSGSTKSGTARELDINKNRMTEASMVLDWCDATVVKDVIAGTKPLSKAVDEARRLKREDAERESKRARLKKGGPDLLARVGEGLDLDEAIAALDSREQRAREDAARQRTAEQEAERKRADEQRDARALLARIIELAAPKDMSNGFVAAWASQLGRPDRELDQLIKGAERAGQVLLDLAEGVER